MSEQALFVVPMNRATTEHGYPYAALSVDG